MDKIDYIASCKVYGQNKIHLPKPLREALNIKKGDILVFYRDSDGEIKLYKVRRVSQRTY